MVELRFARWVPDDLNESLCWYEQRSTATGRRFRQAVSIAFDAIERNPLRYAIASPRNAVRYVRVRRFPYVVLYVMQGDQPVVIGVRHVAGDPKTWQDRATKEL